MMKKLILLLPILMVSACESEIPLPADITSPIISEVSAVVTPARTFTPSYSFNTTEAGTIIYGGDCLSAMTNASVDDNTIVFNALANGSYSNCTVQVKDSSGNTSSTLTVPPFTVEWATRPINDTGISTCSDSSLLDSTAGYEVISASGVHNNDLDCSALTPPVTQSTDSTEVNGDLVRGGQDALFGRDVTHNDDADGHAGFSFTKLGANGIALIDQSKLWNSVGSEATNDQWSCVQDNVTGLIWEVKQDSNSSFGDGLHDADDTYSWYSTDSSNNGGDAGYEDNLGNICTGYNVSDASTDCNTQAYVTRVNTQGLCGFNDWRLPVNDELNNIAANDRISPAIDAAFFPNTLINFYWSSSTQAGFNNLVQTVSFFSGDDGRTRKHNNKSIRLVHGSQTQTGGGCTSNRNANIVITKPDSIYIDHLDGTVSDIETGLTWQKCSIGQTWNAGADTNSGSDDSCDSNHAQDTWQVALAKSNEVSGWRLPNKNELSSLTEVACDNLSINTNFFPNSLPFYYWSSSLHGNVLNNRSWAVTFNDGVAEAREKSDFGAARLVRNQ